MFRNLTEDCIEKIECPEACPFSKKMMDVNVAKKQRREVISATPGVQ